MRWVPPDTKNGFGEEIFLKFKVNLFTNEKVYLTKISGGSGVPGGSGDGATSSTGGYNSVEEGRPLYHWMIYIMITVLKNSNKHY